jgi:hypothetical protein
MTVFVLLVLATFLSRAQSHPEWGFEYRQKIGFLAAHHGTMGHLPQQHAFAGELSWYKRVNGNKQWHEPCGLPYLGATLFGGSVGNNEILGTYWGGYGFIEFPFVRTKHYEFLGKMGTGLAYTSKVYDKDLNPKNVAMSTHVNAQICIGLKSHFIFKRNKITLGLDMTHFSNGAFKVPNLGVNLPYVSLGYARTVQRLDRDSIVEQNVIPFKKWLFFVTAIGSVKEVFPTGRKKYPVTAISTGLRWFSRPKVGFETSLDVISKQAIFAYRPEVEKNQWSILQVGAYIGYLLPLDQLHFALGMGVYLKDKYQPEDFMYHRIGLRYYFPNGLHTQVVLKSHWARADYVEWGVGYTFNFKK